MENEFRVWDKSYKKYVKNMFMTCDGRLLEFTSPAHLETMKDYWKRYIIEHYTGLRDKDRDKIFEGHVVEDDEGKVAYVTFLQQDMGFVLVYPDYDKRLGHRYTGSFYDTDTHLKIIGNLRENPKLIRFERTVGQPKKTDPEQACPICTEDVGECACSDEAINFQIAYDEKELRKELNDEKR